MYFYNPLRLTCLLVVLSSQACSGSPETTERFLQGDSQLVPSRIAISNLYGKVLFEWTDPESLNAFCGIFQGSYSFTKEKHPRRTLEGYRVSIRFKDSKNAEFIIYGTTNQQKVWLLAYIDPTNTSERLIKAVRVEAQGIPQGLRADLERTSLLGKQ